MGVWGTEMRSGGILRSGSGARSAGHDRDGSCREESRYGGGEAIEYVEWMLLAVNVGEICWGRSWHLLCINITRPCQANSYCIRVKLP